jgi:hypothetical protein
MRITKFIDYFVSLRKRFPTLKELEKRTIKENNIKKKLMECDLDKTDWDREKDKENND